MALQDQIKKDLVASMKARDAETTAALRVIMGEFGRTASKILADGDVIKIIKQLYKSEKEVLTRQGDMQSSPFTRVLDRYLPVMASDADIEDWIRTNIDFSRYKNKMQAMRDIMRHFGSGADGNLVKSVLQERF